MPSGTATVTPSNGGATVAFNMIGLTPGSAHTVDVQSGTCPSVAFGTSGSSLGVVTADASGQLRRAFRLLFRRAVPRP